jgi:hypothetical protein
MDKMNKYQKIVKAYLEKEASERFPDQPGLKHHLVQADDGRSIILLVMGWHNGKYHYFIANHIELQGNHIFIHEDNTDIPLAEKLVELGIPASYIKCSYLDPVEQKEDILAG